MGGTLKRSLIGAAAVGVGALSLMSASPALAATGNGDGVCVFTGHANVFASPVAYVGGAGGFGFSGSADCAGQNGGSPVVVTGSALNASGTFSSIVCGTSQVGGVNGTATLTGVGSAPFSLTFAGGEGVITGSFTGSGPFTGDAGTLAGYVNIFPNNQATALVVGGSPNSPQNPTPVTQADPVFPGGGGSHSTSSTCVDQYGVAGAFAFESQV
jgi:hypothetical protein